MKLKNSKRRYLKIFCIRWSRNMESTDKKSIMPSGTVWLPSSPFLWNSYLVDKVEMIYLLTAIGLTPGGSSTVHIYTQTVHRMTQNKQYIEEHNNLCECGPCPVLARFTLAFALQRRKKFYKHTELKENSTCGLVADSNSETERRKKFFM